MWRLISGCSLTWSWIVDQMCHQNYCELLSTEEATAGEERLLIYCKPVELYNILRHRAQLNVMSCIFLLKLRLKFCPNKTFCNLVKYTVQIVCFEKKSVVCRCPFFCFFVLTLWYYMSPRWELIVVIYCWALNIVAIICLHVILRNYVGTPFLGFLFLYSF